MKKLTLVIFIFSILSCSKQEQFETTVKTLPKNVAFSITSYAPYHVTVQAESVDRNGTFVFSANQKKIYETFKTAVIDTADVNITVRLGEIAEAKIVKK